MSTVRNIVLFCFILFGIAYVTQAEQPQDFQLSTNDGVIPRMGFDKAGYADWWWWGYSERHDGYHEMLCGEWAAGIAYSLSGTTKFEWLTDSFSYPDWPTGTSFMQDSGTAWDNASNPISGNDTAQSIIYDPNIRITIDYRLIDLGENGYAAIPFYPEGYSGSDVPYAQSERYVLIQTYNIKNTTSSNITGVKFYQMLTGWYAGMYNSTYSDAVIPGLLDGSYDPCNPNSPTAFRYVSVQWMNGDPNEEHVDWECFSSTIEPTWIGNSVYNTSSGGDSTPGYITYDIKNTNLNEDPNIYDTYAVAGAMGWDLGTLAPGQTKSITVAAMFGTGPVQHGEPIPDVNVNLTITDDTNSCVDPSYGPFDSDVNYTIRWSAGEDINDVNLVCELSEYTTFVSCTGDGDYEPNTVTWNLGDLDVNDTNTYTLKVKVAEDAPQGEFITNKIRMYSGSTLIKTDAVDTNICCVDNVVYVDIDTNDGGHGQTWSTAYNNLQTALNAVREGNHPCATQIWVAAGTYYPTDDANNGSATFQMIDGIDIYGHFAGWGETSIDQRNLADANNATILSGDIKSDQTSDIDIVVTAANNARLDCFTVTKGRNGSSISGAVYSDNVSATIANCIIKDNDGYGLQCRTSDSNSYVSLVNCFVEDNGQIGIYCTNYSPCTGTLYLDISRCTISANNSVGLYANDNTMDVNMTDSVVSGNLYRGIEANGKKLTVQNCDIIDNGGDGIYASGNAQLSVKNCVVSENSFNGIYAASSSQADIANNVIFENKNGAGICINGGTDVNVTNNLVYRNHGYGINLYWTNNSLKITNNTIADNTSYGIFKYGVADPSINSNIIWGNTSGSLTGFDTTIPIYYNCIQGGWDYGVGNTYQNPQFRDEDNNDYHLTTASIYCIDKGNPNFTSSTEKDIDGEDRIMDGDCNNTARVDIGADEFCPYDLVQDGFVDFLDFRVFADTWRKSNQTGYDDYCDFYDDGTTDYINFKDLEIFCRYWLTPTDWDGIGGEGAYFADTGSGEMDMMMSESSMQTESQSEQMMAESQEDQSEENQYYYPADYNLPAIYLTCDDNTPEPNDEVTIWVHGDAPLLCAGLVIMVSGDANITTAMNEADCNEYGWDNGWNSDPYIDDVNGFVYISGIRWDADANGVIGYVKFRYNSGTVNVYIEPVDSMASTWDWDSGVGSLVPLSQEAVIVARDPNDP